MARTSLPTLRLTTPASDLQVEPFAVDASTKGNALVPSTELSVRPFDVRGSTGESSFTPATSFEVKPFDIRLGVGAFSFHIRPFSFGWE